MRVPGGPDDSPIASETAQGTAPAPAQPSAPSPSRSGEHVRPTRASRPGRHCWARRSGGWAMKPKKWRYAAPPPPPPTGPPPAPIRARLSKRAGTQGRGVWTSPCLRAAHATEHTLHAYPDPPQGCPTAQRTHREHKSTWNGSCTHTVTPKLTPPVACTKLQTPFSYTGTAKTMVRKRPKRAETRLEAGTGSTLEMPPWASAIVSKDSRGPQNIWPKIRTAAE